MVLRKLLMMSAVVAALGMPTQGKAQVFSGWQSFTSERTILDGAGSNDELWIGTNSGLYKRAKGDQQWQEFTAINSDLPSSHIKSVAVTPGGKWVGTYAAGVRKIRDSTVHSIPELNQAIQDTFLYAIAPIKGTQKTGFLTEVAYHVYDGEEVITHKLPSSPISIGSWNEKYFKPVSDSTFWLSIGHTFKFFNGDTYEDQIQNNFNPYRDIALAYDEQGRLWASHKDDLAYRAQNQWNWVSNSQTGLDTTIRCMKEGKDGSLYVGSYNQIVVYKNGQWQPWANLEEGFWQDKKDWFLAKQGNEFYLPDEQEQALVTYDGNQSSRFSFDKRKIPGPQNVTAGGDRLWLKSKYPNTMWYFKNGQWEEIAIPENLQDKMSWKAKAVSDREVWVEGDSALFRFHKGDWKRYDQTNTNLPRVNYATNLKVIDEKVWVATQEGLFEFKNGDFVYPEGTSGAFQNMEVSTFTVVDGVYWLFDSRAKRLKKYADGQMTKLKGEWHKGELGTEEPFLMKKDANGNIWIDGSSGHLAKYEAGQWRFPTSLNNITSRLFSGIRDLKVIDSNLLVFATRKGIAFKYPDTIRWVREGNSHLPFNMVGDLAYTTKGQLAAMDAAKDQIAIFDINKTGDQSAKPPITREKPTVQVYPNPVKTTLNLQTPTDKTVAMGYTLFNSQGKAVKQGVINKGEQQIQVGNLTPGVYFLFLRGKDGKAHQKFIKR